jgi:hypothetical protein
MCAVCIGGGENTVIRFVWQIGESRWQMVCLRMHAVMRGAVRGAWCVVRCA